MGATRDGSTGRGLSRLLSRVIGFATTESVVSSDTTGGSEAMGGSGTIGGDGAAILGSGAWTFQRSNKATAAAPARNERSTQLSNKRLKPFPCLAVACGRIVAVKGGCIGELSA